MLTEMYPAQVNSPQTELAGAIDAVQTTITLLDASKVPAGPNILVIGSDETAETIAYTGKGGNDLTGVIRGFQGVAKAWSAGVRVARHYTAYDHESFRLNVLDHETRMQRVEAGYPINAVHRQAAIDGNFAVNLEVKSGTVTLTAGQYGHTMWKAGASGCTYTFTTSANVTTITISAGSLLQVIEGNRLYSGTYTLSWTGTAQGRIGAGSYGASGITGAVTGGTNTNIEFGTGTVSMVTFNFGAIALPFAPRSLAEEMALCMRYYEKTYNVGNAPGAATGTGSVQYIAQNALPASTSGGLAIGICAFVVPKRANPTLTIYSPSGAANAVRVAYGSDRTGASVSAFEKGFNGINFNNISATSVAVGNAVEYHWVADARL